MKNIKQILNFVKNNEFWVEHCPATHQIAEWAWVGFIEGARYFDKKHLTRGLFFYKKDFAFEVTSRREKITQFYFALAKHKKNKSYLKNIKAEWLEKCKLMAKESWEFLSGINDLPQDEIACEYKKLADRYIDFGRYTTFIECVDPLTEDEVPKLLDNAFPKISQSEKSHIAQVMCAFEALSFMEHERIEVLESALKALADKNSLEKTTRILERKYHWIATHYGQAHSKTAKKFKDEILGIIKKKSKIGIKKELESLKKKPSKLKSEKKALVRKYKMGRELREIFDVVAEIGAWIDERKRYAMQMTFIIYKLVEIIGKKLKFPKELLGYTTHDELYRWLETQKQTVATKELKERRKLSVFSVERTKSGKASAKFITGQTAKKIFNAVFSLKKASEFKGTVASAPVKIIRGEASLVMNSTTDKFKEGNILVTTMTRPDFLPLMRKAKAIITDEGGLTCHAAIVSREMGIPCIIGTKIATKSIKTGDVVEMRLDEGKIKIIHPVK